MCDSWMILCGRKGLGKSMLASDLGQVKKSMEQLLSEGAKQFYLSHGGWYSKQRIKGALERLRKA